jgi:polyhydroxyalkanoate synthase subunit PhaC
MSQPKSPAPQDDFARQMVEILDRLRPVMKDYVTKHSGQRSEGLNWDPFQLHNVWANYLQAASRNPTKLIDLQVEYAQNMSHLWQESVRKFLGEQSQSVAIPEKSDKRFRDPLWNENVVFDFIKQSYLLTSRMMQSAVRSVDGLDPKEKAKLDFHTRQFVDSIAPSNFALTNPEVLRETLNSKGQNLIRGLENLVEDLERGGGNLEISKTQYDAYEVGKNIAVTEGSVIFRNDLMELIQYTPTTEKVFATPLLIVPPWINRYYILDMRPDNSFVKWAVDQGHTVFVISWVNPDKKLAKKSFESYVNEGLLAAADVACAITGQKSVNAVGYCIGGTLLVTALAYLAAIKQDKKFASATFLTTLIDFEEAGDLQIFIDEAQLDALDIKMKEKGVLEGRELRNTFSLLRANDLIWSFVVNNYMLGKEPFPFDLLYWNDDSTNMPAAMHSFYLRNMYQKNLLCKKNGITINHQKIDVRNVTTRSYFLSTKEDHIAPWKATYEGMMLLGGDKKFVLSASGHVAGVVNPPALKKYHYWINNDLDDRQHAEEWLEAAQQHEGSWWSDWAHWLEQSAGTKIAARKAGTKDFPVICPAPGTYVRKKA